MSILVVINSNNKEKANCLFNFNFFIINLYTFLQKLLHRSYYSQNSQSQEKLCSDTSHIFMHNETNESKNCIKN